MSSILKIDPKVTRLINYLNGIEEGKIQIPSFQRDFVWGKKEKLELFESLKDGYPIGSLLFWKPKDKFTVKREMGPYFMPESHALETDFYYILDGFQRLSTLFGCLKNPDKTALEYDELEYKKEYIIYYDLIAEEFTYARGSQPEITQMPVNVLIDTFGFLDYCDKLRSYNGLNLIEITKLIDRAREISSAILDYSLPSIEIHGGTIEDAVEIFSRINSKGAKISLDWMVSALTYSEDINFRLGTEIDILLDELRLFNFEKMKREVIIQCIQTSMGVIYFDLKVADLVKRKDFIEVTLNTIKSIKNAVKFLFEELLVVDIKLLPYNSQLVFMTYFFNELPLPTNSQIEELKRWFWVTSYSNYFTIYSLSKQRLAFNKFKEFVSGISSNAVFNDKPNIPFTATDFPKNINFGSVRAKTLVLFLLNFANKFSNLAYEDIDELRIQYLFKGSNSPEAVVPIITFVPKVDDNRELVQVKHADLSILLEYDGDTSFYFITDEMKASNDRNSILETRKYLIQQTEHTFVQTLGMDYDFGSSKSLS